MATWDEIEKDLLDIVTEFNRLYKCLNKTKLPKQETVDEHIVNIIQEYNAIVDLYDLHATKLTQGHIEIVTNNFYQARDKLVSLFIKLKLNILIPLPITEHIQTDLKNPNFDDTINTSDEENDDDKDTTKILNTTNMPQDPEAFARLASQTIGAKYLGDPLGLRSFLNSVKVAEDLVKDENKDLLVSIVISKLDGKAIEAITPQVKTLDDVRAALKAKIRPDNSDIVEGQILALRQDRLPLQEFSKQAEDLADALQRTYIIEGMTPEKANELTIKKTIELCRKNSRSLLVKSILSSSNFPDAKSVISKMIVETANDTNEKQILSFHSNRGSYRGSNRNNRGNYSNSRGNFQPSKSFYNGNNNNNYNSNYSNNYNNNAPRQNAYENRNPPGRGNFNRNNRSNRGGNNSNSRNASIRFMESGNQQAPQQRALGDPNAE